MKWKPIEINGIRWHLTQSRTLVFLATRAIEDEEHRGPSNFNGLTVDMPIQEIPVFLDEQELSIIEPELSDQQRKRLFFQYGIPEDRGIVGMIRLPEEYMKAAALMIGDHLFSVRELPEKNILDYQIEGYKETGDLVTITGRVVAATEVNIAVGGRTHRPVQAEVHFFTAPEVTDAYFELPKDYPGGFSVSFSRQKTRQLLPMTITFLAGSTIKDYRVTSGKLAAALSTKPLVQVFYEMFLRVKKEGVRSGLSYAGSRLRSKNDGSDD